MTTFLRRSVPHLPTYGTQYPICAFEVNFVGPGNLANTTFISGAGLLTYSVSPGTMSVQNGGPGAACGEYSGASTGEGSNIVYGAVPLSAASTVTQTLSFIWQGTAAASGSALHGYWGSDGSQHVNFISGCMSCTITPAVPHGSTTV